MLLNINLILQFVYNNEYVNNYNNNALCSKLFKLFIDKFFYYISLAND